MNSISSAELSAVSGEVDDMVNMCILLVDFVLGMLAVAVVSPGLGAHKCTLRLPTGTPRGLGVCVMTLMFLEGDLCNCGLRHPVTARYLPFPGSGASYPTRNGTFLPPGQTACAPL